MKALGWSISQKCASTIDHSPSNLKVGDVGTVVGPGTSGDDAAQRVEVDFGAGKGKVNVLAKTHIITLEEKVAAPPQTPPQQHSAPSYHPVPPCGSSCTRADVLAAPPGLVTPSPAQPLVSCHHAPILSPCPQPKEPPAHRTTHTTPAHSSGAAGGGREGGEGGGETIDGSEGN